MQALLKTKANEEKAGGEMTAMQRIEEIAKILTEPTHCYQCEGAEFLEDESLQFLLKAFLAMREVAIEEGTSDEWRHRDVEGAIDEEFEERMK